MKISIITLSLLLLFSCSSKEKKDEAAIDLYNQSLKYIKSGHFYSAKTNLEKIENDFPYAKISDKAEILIAFLEFAQGNYDEVIIETEKFIKLRPVNQYIPYMMFLRAESTWNKRSDNYREQETSQIAKNYFLEIITRYQGKYNKTSLERIAEIDNLIANYYLTIARNSLKKDDFIGSINLLNRVKKNYSNTNYINEVRYRLVEAYLKIGLNDQAKYEDKLLQTQAPKSPWAISSSKIIVK